MKARTVTLVCGALFVLAFAACDFQPLTPTAASLVTASVEGSVTSDYTGDGFYRVTPFGRPYAKFFLNSAGTGSSGNQSFAFHGLEKPEVGTYQLGEMLEDVYAATYSYYEGNKETRFRAVTGILEITESSLHRLVGSFQMEGTYAGTCLHTSGSFGRMMQCEPPGEGGEDVFVTGYFEAASMPGLFR